MSQDGYAVDLEMLETTERRLEGFVGFARDQLLAAEKLIGLTPERVDRISSRRLPREAFGLGKASFDRDRSSGPDPYPVDERAHRLSGVAGRE